MPGETIRLWTLQPVEVWHVLQERGSLLANPDHPEMADHIEYFRAAYDWLREQMARRVPGYKGNCPWWAYDHFPDLRCCRWHYGDEGDRMVRLSLVIPKQRVLLSSYDAWHCVLSRGYLPQAVKSPAYEKELAAWEGNAAKHGLKLHAPGPALMALSEPWESQMRASWEHIFDVDARRSIETIQATFERLELADVVKVTEFTARRTKSELSLGKKE